MITVVELIEALGKLPAHTIVARWGYDGELSYIDPPKIGSDITVNGEPVVLIEMDMAIPNVVYGLEEKQK